MTTPINRGAGEAPARLRNDNATTGNRGEVGKAKQQPCKDSAERPLFHPLSWRGSVLIEFAMLLEWLALGAALGLLLWGID